MNKQELLHKVKEANPGMTMKVASAALESILSVIAGALANGEKVTLVDFGTFEVRDRLPREGRNPATGEAMTIPASRVPSFKPGKALRGKVAG